MMDFRVSLHEQNRIAALKKLKILDTPPEKTFDDLTFFISQICEVPIVLITMIDEERQWFKSKMGTEITERPRVDTLCSCAIEKPSEILEISDLKSEHYYSNMEVMKHYDLFTFFASVPIVVDEKYAIGTVCILDFKPKELTENQKLALRKIAEQVALKLKSRKTASELKTVSNKAFRNIRMLEEQTFLLSQSENISKVGHWELDLQRHELYWSSETKKIHEVEDDYTPNLVEGINFYDEESKPLIRNVIAKAIEHGEDWDIKLRIITAKGNKKWVRSVAKAYKAKNKVYKVIGVFQDITKDKKYEEELLNREVQINELNEKLQKRIDKSTKELEITQSRFEKLYNEAPDLMASVDAKTRAVRSCNYTALKRLGYSNEELIGKDLLSLYDPDCHHEVLAAFEQFKTEGSVTNCELILKTASGEKVPVLLNAKATYNDKGEVIYSNSVWRDIGDLKKVQSQLQKLNNELERRVEDRTKELQQMNDELEEYTYMTSHDIKAPLSNIKGFTNILKSRLASTEDPTIKESLKWIDDCILQAQRKIESVVQVAKSKEIKPIDKIEIRGLLDEVLQEHFTPVQHPNTTIGIKILEDEIIRFNRDSLKSILFNLIHNAIKYKKENINAHVEVTVDMNENYSIIAVKDNGLGLDLNKSKKKLFGIFNRLHDHVDGNGIALHLTKNILEKAGGSIEVESQLNKGSTFTVYLPK